MIESTMSFVTYSPGADALYVFFSDENVYRTEELDDRRMLDWAGDGHLIGVELLDVSDGIDLRDIPERPQIEALLQVFTYPVLA